ncbi:MAG: alpha-L-fucosidase [Sedimentisphaerales bacterium]|nr:alpha-L-fucosidase [Sedimentisphaerales bacterium]
MNHQRAICYAACLIMAAAATGLPTATGQAYRPDWDSLGRHPVPQWFQDAKFGIYAHWGVYSVPAFDNEWYPRNMYIEGSKVQKHHLETYGDLSKFGYKDFVPRFQAEKFDAEEWADIYARSGAKFAGPVAEHHDGFSLWASKVNRWNAAAMGPKRDVTGELVRALRQRGLKIITSFHHAYNIQGYYTAKDDWDTNDPAYGDLYGKFEDPKVAHDRWLAKIVEVIDRYQPDQIWYDFGLAKIPDEYKRTMAAYYYNKQAEWGKQVIITRKGDHLPAGVGVLDIERGKMEGPADFLWQTDDSVATNTWCFTAGIHLKTAEELIHELVDIVSKNGVLLLNVCPRADGIIPDDQKDLLLAIGNWLGVNGQAIYASRPWKIHGEGPNLYDRGRGLGGNAQGQIRFAGRDIRYTCKGDILYAICLGRPEKSFPLRFVQIDTAAADAGVELLGHDGKVDYHIDDNILTIRLASIDPAALPFQYAYAFKLTGFGISPSPEAAFARPGAVTLKAEQAVLEGSRIKLETIQDRSSIGYWDDPREKIHWLVKIAAPGTYRFRGEFSAANGASPLRFEIDGQSLRFESTASRGWDDFRQVDMGRIRLERSGIYHGILQADRPDRWKAVNVRRIQLAEFE